MPGKQITNNALAIFKIFYYQTEQIVGLKEVMALKLDMAKAYNYIESAFLETFMLKLGFNTKWVNLIM